MLVAIQVESSMAGEAQRVQGDHNPARRPCSKEANTSVGCIRRNVDSISREGIPPFRSEILVTPQPSKGRAGFGV